jgi:hypothetical protein
MPTLWRYHRKALLIGAIPVTALLLLLGIAASVLHVVDDQHRASSAGASASPPTGTSSSAPNTTGAMTSAPRLQRPSAVSPSDIASWDAIPPVHPAVSAKYPAIIGASTRQPYSDAKAFVTELFNQDYLRPRSELLSWAQYESVPLVTNGLPPRDEAKGLVDSLTDISWNNEPTSPVPPVGQWLSLQAQRGYLTSSNVLVTADSAWQQEVAAGHVMKDKKMMVIDATLTTTLHTTTARQATATPSTVSLKLMLGSSTHGDGYGVMYVGTYVTTAVS